MKFKFIFIATLLALVGCDSGSGESVTVEDNPGNLASVQNKENGGQSENVESNGEYNTPPSSDSREGSTVDSLSSSSFIKDNEHGSSNVWIPKVSGSLEEYARQFTDDPQELSFDSSVLAYNGTGYSPANVPEEYLVEGVRKLDKDSLDIFFPGIKERIEKHQSSERCDYYLMIIGDASQPSGCVVQSVQKDSILLVGVARTGDMCMSSNNYIRMGALIENCSGENLAEASIQGKLYKSQVWNCNVKDGPAIYAYGYWIKEELL